jgi:hypothetical protein
VVWGGGGAHWLGGHLGGGGGGRLQFGCGWVGGRVGGWQGQGCDPLARGHLGEMAGQLHCYWRLSLTIQYSASCCAAAGLQTCFTCASSPAEAAPNSGYSPTLALTSSCCCGHPIPPGQTTWPPRAAPST